MVLNDDGLWRESKPPITLSIRTEKQCTNHWIQASLVSLKNFICLIIIFVEVMELIMWNRRDIQRPVFTEGIEPSALLSSEGLNIRAVTIWHFLFVSMSQTKFSYVLIFIFIILFLHLLIILIGMMKLVMGNCYRKISGMIVDDSLCK